MSKTIEEAEWFYELLDEGDKSLLIERFQQFKIHHVLDIGCGNGISLQLMNLALDADYLEGVELRPWKALVEEYHEIMSGKPNHKKDVSTMEELWNAVFKITSGQAMPKKLWSIAYETSIGEYASQLPPGKKYDAIIVSQVLHMTNERDIQCISEILRNHTHAHSMIYYSMKDDYQQNKAGTLQAEDVFNACCTLMKDLRDRNVKYTLGPKSETQGWCHIYTNL